MISRESSEWGEGMRLIKAALAAAMLARLAMPVAAQAQTDAEAEQAVAGAVQAMLSDNGAGGVAVAVRIDGRSLFFEFGAADLAKGRKIGEDSIFNLASVGKLFATTLLAQAVARGELGLDDPVAKYVTELRQGGDIRQVTLGQIASHTSGLPRVPQSEEPWHKGKYSLPDFMRFLTAWKASQGHEPGKQYLYSNAAMVLLRIVLERRFDKPFASLMAERLTGPLGMASTALPLPPSLMDRAVQGYGPRGRPIGQPGGEQGIFEWPGAGQIYSSPRDMSVFLAANLGELRDQRPLEDAMALAQKGVFEVRPRFTQALAWQVINASTLTIIDKNGGLDSTSTYIGMVPARKLGIVILANRGKQRAAKVGRRLLHVLAHDRSAPADAGAEPD